MLVSTGSANTVLGNFSELFNFTSPLYHDGHYSVIHRRKSRGGASCGGNFQYTRTMLRGEIDLIK